MSFRFVQKSVTFYFALFDRNSVDSGARSVKVVEDTCMPKLSATEM